LTDSFAGQRDPLTRNLITGGFGFVGRHLVLMLADAGHEVTLFDVVQDPPFPQKGNGRIEAIMGSLANWPEVLDVVVATKPDFIYHSGAMLPPASEVTPQAASQVRSGRVDCRFRSNSQRCMSLERRPSYTQVTDRTEECNADSQS